VNLETPRGASEVAVDGSNSRRGGAAAAVRRGGARRAGGRRMRSRRLLSDGVDRDRQSKGVSWQLTWQGMNVLRKSEKGPKPN